MPLNIDTLTLGSGSHNPGSDVMCVMELFWLKVARGDPDECWEWQAGCDDDGYGTFRHDGKMKKAHRLAWIFCSRGPIPDGLVVMHSCDNPPCCNPAHLSLGTVADNNRDRHNKGRSKNLFTSAAHPRRSVTDLDRDTAIRMRAAGATQQTIADTIGCSRGHVAHLVAGVLPTNTRAKG